MSLTRRDALFKCLALGFITTASSARASELLEAFEEKQSSKATPEAVLGPFYKKGAPQSASLRIPNEPGMPLRVRGRVFDTSGAILQQASVEVWHADHLGEYDVAGYQHRAKLISSAKGEYDFNSIMPGHYPDRVCQHIHYLVQAPGCNPLVTQMYFGSDPVFEGDPAKNFHRDPLATSADLVRPVMLVGDPKTIEASVVFDVILERL